MSTAKRILDNQAASRSRIKANKGSMYAHMSGVDNVIKGLQNCAPNNDQKYAILKELADPLIAKIRSLIPKKSGALLRSVQMFRSKRDAYGTIWIGPRYISAQMINLFGGDDAGNHAHIIEEGTSERKMTTGLIYGDTAKSTYEKFKGPWFFKPFAGKETGKVGGIHFMQRSFDEMKDWIFTRGSELLAQSVEENARKEGIETK